MIKIFAKKDEIFLKCKEKIYYFKLIELEKDLEDIIFQCNLDKKEKIYLILDFEANESQYYIDIFTFYNFKIRKLVEFQEILSMLNEEIIYLGEKSSLHIKDKKIEKIDVCLSDEFDYNGIRSIYVRKENIEEIFDIIEKVKIRKIYAINLLKKDQILILISAMFLISSYITTTILYSTDKLEKSIQVNRVKKGKIDADILNTKEYIKKLEKEISENEVVQYLSLEIKNTEYYTLIKDIISYTKKGIDLKSIEYINNTLIVEGQADDYNSVINNFKDFTIDYLVSENDRIGFKILKEGLND